jgi:phosphonate transport system ATP-binding protein
MTPAFALQGATVRYGTVVALAGVTLTISRGERVGLIGPSGSGKSTLLRVLNGSTALAEGRAEVDGIDLATMDRATLRACRSRLGLMPQHLGLVPNLRVVQNVAIGRLGQMSTLAALRHILFPSRPQTEQIHALLERVGLAEKLYQRVDRLSGGQQQRVALARALWQNPTALLADEPVAALDPARARDILRRLVHLSEEQGLTLLASLHQPELASAYFTRLIGLRSGRILFDCPAPTVSPDDWTALYTLSLTELGEGEPAAREF